MRGKSGFKKVDRFLGIPLVYLLGVLSGLWPWKDRKPLGPGDRVLVVKLSALGDTLLLLPVYKAIKETVGPKGFLTAIATPINQAALEGNPAIDRLFILDFGKPFEFLRVIRELRAENIRVALDFDQWLRISPLLSWLSGASARFGFKTKGQFRHFLYDRFTENGKGKHETELFADVAALAGIDPKKVEPYTGFLKREGLFRKDGTEPVKAGKPLVHLHPGCGFYGWQRAWPPEHYAKLARELHEKTGAVLRMTGMGEYEEDLVKQIAAWAGVPIELHLGHLGISELSSLLREADLVVCGNTGILHLAVGLDRAVVAPHGPADHVKWGPTPPYTLVKLDSPVTRVTVGDPGKVSKVRVITAGLLCSPCTALGFEYGCTFRPCMETIPVDAVVRECLSVLEGVS
jgi:heptosyltransferase I